MLPLVSSMTTTVIGWISFSKKTIGCGFSLSKTSKSSCVRPGTSRRCASATVDEQRDDLRARLECRSLRGGCCAASAIDTDGRERHGARHPFQTGHGIQLSAMPVPSRAPLRSPARAPSAISL